MNRKYHVLLMVSALVGGLLFLSACKSTKKLTERKLKILSFGQLYQKMEINTPSFAFLNAKLGVNYQKGEKEPVQFRIQIRLKTDSIIWMSLVPAMGIEAARVVLTADSVMLLNRVKKNYVLGSYQLIDSLMHTRINYAMLQAMLLGNSVAYPILDSAALIDGNQYLLDMKMKIPVTGSEEHMLTQKVWLDPETFRIKAMFLSESGMQGKSLQIFYDEYQNIDGKILPLKMQIIIQAKEKIVININYKKTEVDVRHSFPFIIPSKYKKLI